MVAAWISAETGVGPSIASGSQVWSGTWADFANAPTQISRQIVDDDALVRAEGLARGVERRQEVEGPELAEDEQRGEHEADVADDVDHERLHARLGRGRAPVPEADQRVGGEADERPADDQDDEVAREDEQQHREDEEVEVAEEARVAAVGIHVGQRVEMDQGRDPGHHEAHEHRQRVDEDPELDVETRGGGVAVERVGELARVGRLAEQPEERSERADEGERDRRGADPAGGSSGQRPMTERDHQAAGERQREHQPGPRSRHLAPRSRRLAACSLQRRARSPPLPAASCERRSRSSPMPTGSLQRRARSPPLPAASCRLLTRAAPGCHRRSTAPACGTSRRSGRARRPPHRPRPPSR